MQFPRVTAAWTWRAESLAIVLWLQSLLADRTYRAEVSQARNIHRLVSSMHQMCGSPYGKEPRISKGSHLVGHESRA